MKQRVMWMGTMGAAALLCLGSGCSSKKYGDIKISANVAAADGLDLKAVGEKVKEAKDAEHLEKLLNEPEGINNLDLDQDGKVDFIKVTEYGNDSSKGFSLTVEPAEGETQEIATIEVEKAEDKAHVYVTGNEQVYGAGHHYHHSHSLSTFLLMAYLLRPHPFYVSPFRYGYYPGYWGGGHRTVTRTRYTTRTQGLRKGSTAQRVAGRTSSLTSPNKGRSASKGIRASLRKPTTSQRSFQKRSSSSGTRSGGFGRRSGTSSRTTSPSRTRSAPRRTAPRRAPMRRSRGFGRSRR